MSETTLTDPLEQKRFVVTPSSMEAMKKIRKTLPELQKQFPYIIGVSFFGSRTKGKESSRSDIDVRLFYDGSKLGFDDYEEKAYGFPDARSALSAAAAIPLDHHDWAYDISDEATKEDLKYFILYTDGLTRDGVLEEHRLDMLLKNPVTQRLFSRFFLAFGDGVYRNRQYVLDQLKQTPNGESYFQMLMESMALFERSNGPSRYQTPKFEGYPKTITEAEKYFLRKSQQPDRTQAIMQVLRPK